jgi:MoaA/NifB/PqqE/SkfB family radical SAM enzyme
MIMATELKTFDLEETQTFDALEKALGGQDRTVCILRSAPIQQVRSTIERIRREAPATRLHLLCQRNALSHFAGNPSIDRVWEYPDQPALFAPDGLDARTLEAMHASGIDAVVIPEHNEDGLNYERAREMAFHITDRVIEISTSEKVRLSCSLRSLATTPRQYVVAASSRCNLSCIFCASGDRRHEFGSDFQYNSFERILSSLKNPHAIFALLLGGEPFLNPNLLRMVRDIKSRGRFVSITTNANLIDQATAEELVRCGLDELRISINAAEKKLYQTVMGNASWSKLLQALAALHDAKQKSESSKPSLRFIMVGMKMNIHELPAVTRLAGNFGVETVILNCFMPNPRLTDQSLLEDLPALRRYYDEATAIGAPLGVNITLDEADQYKQALLTPSAAVPAQASKVPAQLNPGSQTRICLDPWLTVHLYETGVVLPCCGGIRQSFGDLNQTELLEIWNGPSFQSLRDSILSGQLRPECRDCKMRAMGPASQLRETLGKLGIQSSEAVQ